MFCGSQIFKQSCRWCVLKVSRQQMPALFSNADVWPSCPSSSEMSAACSQLQLQELMKHVLICPVSNGPKHIKISRSECEASRGAEVEWKALRMCLQMWSSVYINPWSKLSCSFRFGFMIYMFWFHILQSYVFSHAAWHGSPSTRCWTLFNTQLYCVVLVLHLYLTWTTRCQGHNIELLTRVGV